MDRVSHAAHASSTSSPTSWESEALYHAMLDSVSDGIIAIDARGVLRCANRAALTLFGYASREVVGRDVSLLIPAFEREQPVSAPSRCDVVGRRSDGAQLQLDLTLSEVTSSAAPLFVATLRQAGDRADEQAGFCAEHEFVSAVLETTGAVVVVLDPAGRIVRFNRAGQRLTGYSLEEVAGRLIWHLFVPSDEVEQVERAFKLLAGKHYPNQFESCWVMRDGSRRLLAWSNTAIEDAGGSIKYVVGTGIDVTDRRQAEQALYRSEEQLRESQKLETIGLLASGIAHDFGNLASVMLASSAALEAHIGDDRAAHAELDLIRHAAEQASGITGSLLTFSRDDPVDKCPVRLQSVVTAAADLLRRILPARIDLIVQLPEDDDSWVNADASQLQQVLLNLAINARDAMPEGGMLRIDLACSSPASDVGLHRDTGRVGRISVSDTGSGISQELRARIFQPFFSTKARGQGVGLGLALAQGVVSEHGGRIEVRSEPGRGTTFVVELPCIVSPPVAPDDERTRAALRAERARVLLAEGHEQVRAALAATLEALGCEVVQVGDGPALLERFLEQRDRVGLLVVDDALLDHSELMRLAALRRANACAPAAVLTGGASTVADSFGGTMDIVLRKPFEMSEFTEAVAKLLAASVREEPAR